MVICSNTSKIFTLLTCLTCNIVCLLMLTQTTDATLTLYRHTYYCDQYFFGTYFPRMKGDQSGSVRLCQTQQHRAFEGPAIYATLYNTSGRIPIYSATTIQLYPNCSGYSRPDDDYWDRVSLTLCDANLTQALDMTSPSGIGYVESYSKKCGLLQAQNFDYKGNREKINVDRGHLNPNAINCQDRENQVGTFTLTNAAPQFSKFNENAWSHYECITEYVILKYVPTERVYVITGTWGTAEDSHGKPLWMNADDPTKNPVKIPGYYWKAVCYPGNAGNDPWGYAVMHVNSNSATISDPANFMTLAKFSSTYFLDDLFEDVCLSAKLGPVEKYFETWSKTLSVLCPPEPRLSCYQ